MYHLYKCQYQVEATEIHNGINLIIYANGEENRVNDTK